VGVSIVRLTLSRVNSAASAPLAPIDVWCQHHPSAARVAKLAVPQRHYLLRPAAGAGPQCIWLPAVPTWKASPATLMTMSTENSSTVAREAVTQHIIDLVGKDGEIATLTADSSLQSQGLDSLKVMSLVFKIEEHYDIVLDEGDADDLRTVDDLAALVVRRIEEQS
jgi:acyl carrier protein